LGILSGARLLLMLMLLIALVARADIVAGLHTARVPVADQGSAALAAASRKALAEVLVKVSGSRELLQNPVIRAALDESRSHVQQYAYVRGESPGEGLAARFEFDGTYITQLVAQSGAPLWTANRPLVLAWVVVEDAAGRHFINRDTAPAESQQLEDEFSRRGVPVQLPLFDLVDTAAVSTGDVWSLNANAVLDASERYNVQDIVMARMNVPGTGEVKGNWSYFYQGDHIDRPVTAVDMGSFRRGGVEVVAGKMAARYAVATTTGDDGDVRMSVTGVYSYADYASIVSWLESLELVEYANIERLRGDRLELRLGARAEVSQLPAIIELNSRLVPAPRTELDPQLSYQWQN
jgi:hypothetical protein